MSEIRIINRKTVEGLVVVHPQTESAAITDWNSAVKVVKVDNATTADNATQLNGQAPTYYLSWSNLTGKPTTASGYGITDVYTKTQVDATVATLNNAIATANASISTETTNREKADSTIQADVNTRAKSADVYTKTEVDAKVSSVYRYKGSVTTYEDLPTTGQVVGDTYNVVAAYGSIPAGANYAWNGTEWDSLPGTVDLTAYSLKANTVKSIAISGRTVTITNGDNTTSTATTQDTTYTIATASTAGLVKPVAKTTTMTQSIGVDSNGLLYTNPGEIYTLPIATTAALGGVKSSTTGTTTNRDYLVEVDSSTGIMKVNVPWVDTNTTYTAVTPIVMNGTAISHATSGASAGTYSAVTINTFGHVTAGGQILEWGASGVTTASSDLVVGGLFFQLA